ncbi:MAG: HD domain-containing protein [bacterium]
MKIPKEIEKIITKIEKAGHEVFFVGGCVRDLLSGKEPLDYDMTTSATPEEILKVFGDAKYENDFGTVLVSYEVKINGEKKRRAVETTTYRSEQGYRDKRRPDEVRFEKDLDKDLARRDFTINALAMKASKSKIKLPENLKKYIKERGEFIIVDLFGGESDLKKKIVRAVGEPSDRFREDALRMMRAVRFACQLGFSIEPKTERAIVKNAGNIKFIAKERVGVELQKILESSDPYRGIMVMHEAKLLQYIIPELENGKDMPQNHHHIYSVFKHNVLSLKFCPSLDWRVRFAALLHDIAKPQTRKIINNQTTFYNHDFVGAKVASKIMDRLKYSSEDSEKVVNLVKNHMFYYNVGEVTEASVRRLIQKTGKENLKDLIDLRIADRLGSGTPKAKPYKLRHLEYIMKKVQNDPVSVKMLKIDGSNIMKILNITPSPKIGAILDVLLAEVIEDKSLNNKKYLEKRSKELDKLDLAELRKKAREAIEEKREVDDLEIKKEFYVK